MRMQTNTASRREICHALAATFMSLSQNTGSFWFTAHKTLWIFLERVQLAARENSDICSVLWAAPGPPWGAGKGSSGEAGGRWCQQGLCWEQRLSPERDLGLSSGHRADPSSTWGGPVLQSTAGGTRHPSWSCWRGLFLSLCLPQQT